MGSSDTIIDVMRLELAKPDFVLEIRLKRRENYSNAGIERFGQEDELYKLADTLTDLSGDKYDYIVRSDK